MAEPWPASLSVPERIWFLVYEPEEHRKLLVKLDEFSLSTKQAGKQWAEISLADCFPTWMAEHEYRENYFEDPEALSDELGSSFKAYVIEALNQRIHEVNPGDFTLTVIKDVTSLFGFVRLSEILDGLASTIKGRLLILFPGSYEHNHYRLLNARDGWSYLARPIISEAS